MRPKIIFTFKILLIFAILFTSFFYTIFSTDGGVYNIFYPEISTIYSKDFEIREFEKIQTGDSYKKVQQKIGNPLVYNKISNGSILNYTIPGKWKYGEYAFHCYEITISNQNIVISKKEWWCYNY